MPIKSSIAIGDSFVLSCGSIATIIKYHSCSNIIIETNTGFIGSTHAQLLKTGKATDWNYKSLAEVGFIGFDPKTIKNYKLAGDIAYETWRKMIKRCYKENWFLGNPTYQNAIVCDEWFSFKVFKIWFDDNYIEGYHLDKDLKGFGLKVYSPYNCIFIPQEINKLFYVTNKEKVLPIGVKNNGYSYVCTLSDNSFRKIKDAQNEYWNIKYKIIQDRVNTFPKFKEIIEDYFEYYFNKHYKETK